MWAVLWGAIATAVVPLLTSPDPTTRLFRCPIGAGIAAGSIAVAKRAALEPVEEGEPPALSPPDGGG